MTKTIRVPAKSVASAVAPAPAPAPAKAAPAPAKAAPAPAREPHYWTVNGVTVDSDTKPGGASHEYVNGAWVALNQAVEITPPSLKESLTASAEAVGGKIIRFGKDGLTKGGKEKVWVDIKLANGVRIQGNAF